ncbi:MAG TPA: oligosaccharide flippase family protein [Vicinamibacterales bacterium]
MSRASSPASAWGEDSSVVLVARNVSTRYVAYVIDAVLGLVMLPFNLSHLGMAAYGLWMLTTSITVYFSMMDLGYGGALVRFVAHYRARRDARALNEVLSTMAVIYLTIGAIAYAIVLTIAYNLHLIASLTPEQANTSRELLLIIGANVALRFVFGVFGGVIVGFQRYHLNNLTSIATSVLVALVNVAVLMAGYGVVHLVAATTAVRIAALLVYRINAYRVFPGLSLRFSLFDRKRLKEVSGLSVFMLALDGAYKVNYSTDVLVIGTLIGAPAVAFWSPAQRLCEVALKLSNQLSDALFPMVVDCDATQRESRLRKLFVQGTRLSLAAVIPIAGGLALVADPLLRAWLGSTFAQTATIVQILALVVIVRVGASTASIVLKGAGMHKRLVAFITVMGIVNILLSVALVRPMGLSGVAVGTLVPVAAISLLGLIPSACRRVGISLFTMFRQAIWPALWPAAAMSALLLWSRAALPAKLSLVALQLAVGCVVYLGLFSIAIGTESRREYMRHVDVLWKRTSRLMRQVGTANAS